MNFSLSRVFQSVSVPRVLASVAMTGIGLSYSSDVPMGFSFLALSWVSTGFFSHVSFFAYNMAQEAINGVRLRKKENVLEKQFLDNVDSHNMTDSVLGTLIALPEDMVQACGKQDIISKYGDYKKICEALPLIEEAEKVKKDLLNTLNDNKQPKNSQENTKVSERHETSADPVQEFVKSMLAGPIVAFNFDFLASNKDVPVTLPNKTEEYKQTMARWNALKPQ